jgi:GxxExxY protein
MDTDEKVLHEDLTKDIIGAAFDVHNALGCGLLEKVYENALAWELALRRHTVTPLRESSRLLTRTRKLESTTLTLWSRTRWS